MIKKLTMSLLVPIFLLTTGFIVGCETTSHAQQGEVIGGVIGGVLGAQIGEGRGRTTAIIVGTIAGDDTVFIATESAHAQKNLISRIEQATRS